MGQKPGKTERGEVLNNYLKMLINRWIEIVSVSLSIIAITVSIRGCFISNEALDVSKNSIRPFVKIQPIEDKKEFMKLFKTKEGYELKIRFRTTNKGKTPAINIKPSFSIDLIKPNVHPGRKYIINTLEAFSLGPDESIVTEFYMNMSSEVKSRIEYIANAINNGSAEFDLRIDVPYYSVYDKTKVYLTKMHVHIRKNSANLIDSQQY
jgi:hypothetical protein